METETIRKIDENTIAIDTVEVNTTTYDKNFLLSEKSFLEEKLVDINEKLSRFDEVNKDEPQLEAIKLEDIIPIEKLSDKIV